MCYRLRTIDISTKHIITRSCYMFMIWLLHQKVEGTVVVVELQARGCQASHCSLSLCFNICNSQTFTFSAFSRCFCPRRLTVIHTFIRTLMVVVAIQGADQHIRSSLGFRILPKNILTWRPGESNQQASNKKTLALPLRRHPTTTIPLGNLMKTSDNL